MEKWQAADPALLEDVHFLQVEDLPASEADSVIAVPGHCFCRVGPRVHARTADQLQC